MLLRKLSASFPQPQQLTSLWWPWGNYVEFETDSYKYRIQQRKVTWRVARPRGCLTFRLVFTKCAESLTQLLPSRSRKQKVNMYEFKFESRNVVKLCGNYEKILICTSLLSECARIRRNSGSGFLFSLIILFFCIIYSSLCVCYILLHFRVFVAPDWTLCFRVLFA